MQAEKIEKNKREVVISVFQLYDCFDFFLIVFCLFKHFLFKLMQNEEGDGFRLCVDSLIRKKNMLQ